MEKELKDYLYFYLGCECMTPKGVGKLFKYDIQTNWTWCEFGTMGPDFEDSGHIESVKPVLRALSDMTEEEKKEFLSIIGEPQMYRDGFFYLGEYGFLNIRNNNITTSFGFNPESIKYLLSKHFDIFGLIEAGLAVNAAELKAITE